MQEIKSAVESRMEDSFDVPDFGKLSEKWAIYCLGVYQNELLKRGLELSQALKQFDDAFKMCTGEKEIPKEEYFKP